MIKYRFKETFERLVAEYQTLPQSKKLIYSMVKFDQLYRNLEPRGYYRFVSENLGAVKRAEIYATRKALVKTTKGRKGKSLVLTSKGRKIFFKEYPLAKLRKRRWNGNWTAISYDLPATRQGNSRRNRLRYNLKNFGFGQLHQSLVVSPLPLEEPLQEFIEGERLEGNATVFTCRRIWGLPDWEIARRAYNLDQLEKLYEELNSHFDEAKKTREDWDRWCLYFLAVDNLDPQLPKELLPRDWLGFDCTKKFKSRFSRLPLLEKLLC